MLNRISVNNAQLLELIYEYDRDKGIGRTLFGPSEGIKELKNFINRQLVNKGKQYQLNEAEIEALITLLKNQFQKIIWSNKNYRNSPNKLTNRIYIKLANLVAGGDPKILSLVQAFKNDFTFKSLPLYKTQEDIFVTTNGYAFTTSDIKEHIKSTESFSYPLYPGLRLSTYTRPLSEDDISKLKNIPALRIEIELIEKKFSSYNNRETFEGEYLYFYPKNKLFVTEDNNFCFLIDELLKILNEQNQFYNPYTKTPLSESDVKRLLELPEIIKANNFLKSKQELCASKISRQTILELKKLAECLLNKNEIHNGFFDPIPRAQTGYENFNTYYQTLNVTERNALDDYWIDRWDTIEIMNHSLSGMAPTKFKNLYESFNQSCVHSIGGSIVKAVIQLAPDTKFDVHGSLAKSVVNLLKNRTDLKYSAFVTGSNDPILRKTLG